MVKQEHKSYLKKEQSYFSQQDNQKNQYASQINHIKSNKNQKISKNHFNQQSSSYDNESSDQNLNQHQFQSNSQIEQSNENEIQNKMILLKKQQQKIKQQLKQLPYQLILKQKNQLQLQKQSIARNLKQKSKKLIRKSKNNQSDDKKDKNAPKQIPIHKKPPKKVYKIFEPQRSKTIDPRFQDYAGSYNQDLAMKAFDFIPKIQQQQINAIKNVLKKSKITTGNRRNRGKNLSENQRKNLQQQYNKLTNQKRQQQLFSIQKQAKHNLKQQFTYQNPNSQFNSAFIPKNKFKQEFQKVKLSKMSQESRKDYLKDKQKKILKNQQVQRNNIMFQTSQSRYKSKNRI